ncbi:MAG TPA: 2'-deoxycytidine 5'-triphosphate deaminase [Chryseosolibacter sp.]
MDIVFDLRIKPQVYDLIFEIGVYSDSIAYPKLSILEKEINKKMIWQKENWIPGVLSKNQLSKLVNDGFILNASKDFKEEYDHSSMDLHITSEAYEMKGSIKPCGEEYKMFYENSELATRLDPNSDGEFELKSTHTYLFKIRESFSPLASKSNIYAQATAKSTIGRLDVVARLIVDGMHVYEYMEPQGISSGNMFLEISPITFNIKVKEGISLSQIRFFLGKPSESIIPNESISKIVLKGDDHIDGTLSIDLMPEKVGGLDVTAFSAIGVKSKNDEFIPVWEKEGVLEPERFWKCIPSTMIEGRNRFNILPDEFYILRSKERISLPKGVAVYCQAMDETLGEMRIHYAGFAHPFFGVNRRDRREGTPLIFEVRGHNVKVNLTDGEKLAKLVFYRMSEDSIEPKVEATAAKTSSSKQVDSSVKPNLEKYNNQELLLSKVFKDWPDQLTCNADFTVTKK